MQHALALARKGIGLTSPNPMVGCVIVREGQIVGEGFHQYEWREHAEIVALKSAGNKARGATLYVTLKSALTLDGQLALPKSGKETGKSSGERGDSIWITSEESRAEVHRMRHASDAVVTGIGTILADDPLLTDRSGLPRRRHLLRVILDSKLRLSPKSRIVRTSDDDLLVFTAVFPKSAKARKLQKAGVEIMRTKTKNGRIDLSAVLSELGRREILSVMLEAGSLLNGAALAADIVHKLVLFYAPKIAGGTRVPFALAPKLTHSTLQNVQIHQFGPDLAIEAYLRDVFPG